MEQQTKKMALTKAELRKAQGEHTRTLDLFHKLRSTEVNTEEGKSAKDESVAKLQSKINTIWIEMGILKARLEVETIAMLAGEDTEMAEPTPADALRSAS